VFTSRRQRWNVPRSTIAPKLLVIGSRAWLIREADIFFSRYIRRRDKACVLCGTFKRLECGHFFSRAYLRIRWDERNAHANCHFCNQRHIDNQRPYIAFMLKTYSSKVIDELNVLRRSLTKVTDEDIRAAMNYYRKAA
jgi:transcription elongation factor Elf1